MARRDIEPGSVAYMRRIGGEPVLEPTDIPQQAGMNEYYMVCGMGGSTVWIHWFGWNVDDARRTFRDWLDQPWQTLSTGLDGHGVQNGLDFKTGRIDWFNIAG